MSRIFKSLLLILTLVLTLAAGGVAQAVRGEDSGRANQLYADGRALEERGELERAYNDYREAFELDPGHYRALYRAGRLLHQLGHPSEAISALQRTVALAPDFYPACNQLGLVFTDIGNGEAAVQAFKGGVESVPDMASGWRNYARALAETGELQQAATAYEKAVALEPSQESSLVALGILYGRLGERDSAVAVLNKALELIPGDAYASDALEWVRENDLGSTSGGTGERVEGEPATSVVSESASEPLAGGSFTLSGLYRPPSLELESPVKLRDQGIRLIHQGQYAAGMDALEHARSYGEHDAVLFSELGYAHFQRGEYEASAWAYGMAAAQSRHPEGWLWLNQSLALHEAGDLPGAEKAIRRAVDQEPGLAHARYLLGMIRLEQDKLGDATRCFTMAIKLDPLNLSPYLALGATYTVRHKTNDAIKSYRAALRIAPGNAEALYHLAPLLEQQGQVSEALDAYEALQLATANIPASAAWNAQAGVKVKELAWAASQQSPPVAGGK